ncbi:MAG: hypothetical protein LBE70_03555 [Nitrososphaerota archaeon]|jgi:ABC-type enterochelin transport system permease subunit|nr:hypothetical protein [Nitrososphaerota archaeon]
MGKPQITVSYEPFQEIVVLEKNYFSSPEELARFTSIIAGGKLAGLYWVNGVVFLYFPLSSSTALVAKDLLEKRKVYWSYLGYAIMPKFVSVIETKEKIIVPLIDVSSDSVLAGVTDWLKQQI